MSNRLQNGFLRYLLRFLLLIVALFVMAAVAVTLLRIPLDLSRYKPLLESTASQSLGRDVRIDGDIVVTTSLWPYFEIEGLHIANPGGAQDGDLAVMDLARVSVGLLPLLQRRLRIREFRVTGLRLDLVRSADGTANWVLETAESDAEQSADTAAAGEQRGEVASDSLSIDELSLEQIRVSFRDGDAAPLEFVMDHAGGAAAFGDSMSLSMQGTLLEEAFTLEVKADSLGDFLAMNRSRLGLQLDIAATRFRFLGLSEALRGGRATELQVSVDGANLSSLDDLLRLDLPPLVDYRLQAVMRAVPGKLELTGLEASVKDSVLRGTMEIDQTGSRPLATVDLSASTIQLQDFDTGDWTAEGGASIAAAQEESGTEETQKEQELAATSRDKLLSPAALQRADARFTFVVDEVLSGKDRLGSGKLHLTLQDGRIDLAPLQLQLPQASLLVQASFKPGNEASQAALRVVLENFDFGVLARLSNPDSDVGGTLSVDIDVTSSASNSSTILSGANGHLDISGNPENFSSGLVDLWAVNLLSAVVTSSAKDENVSEINCFIGRFRLVDGLMTAENLAADTSKIRICGKGNISFVDETFNLVVAPKAKRPEFFNLATPLAVKGDFDDFRIGMKAGVLTLGTTAVHFAISPVATPIKRLFRDDLPEDGADMCSLPIGPRERELEPLPGC